MKAISARRLWALCLKESYQIVRDPSSILVAFVMPVLLLFVMGYAVNLDAAAVRVGLVVLDGGTAAQRFAQTLAASGAFEVHRGTSVGAFEDELAQGRLRGVVVIGNDFGLRLRRGDGGSAVQVLADGAEPNTANFVAAYVQGVWERFNATLAQDAGKAPVQPIAVELRSWFNPSTVSRNYLVPGSIAIVMTIIGALLTSLVVAREWERGTMEALLATPVTRAELLLSKILPYYALGLAAMLLCLLVSVAIMGVPFRGSVALLTAMTTLFLGCALGLGLFLSSVFRNQFNAAQAALIAAFLPSLMLSGVIYEISSMPRILQWITRFIPARYFASSLQTLFQAGDIGAVLGPDAFFLALLTLFWIGLTALKTKRTLD
ncbi:MAG: ABC transporter permease [Burkholderiales bacterium]|nr:ABC transporter permease [Burkholderiales bacterium]MDE1928863.1 ABC transporter permease [Burkholderiales bacterium]MDE2159373.1 ABC transporter permease [Burkholderiales bacterium]MDE2502949.1 ABC transporter permease [Burkholderiales bacterium]